MNNLRKSQHRIAIAFTAYATSAASAAAATRRRCRRPRCHRPPIVNRATSALSPPNPPDVTTISEKREKILSRERFVTTKSARYHHHFGEIREILSLERFLHQMWLFLCLSPPKADVFCHHHKKLLSKPNKSGMHVTTKTECRTKTARYFSCHHQNRTNP